MSLCRYRSLQSTFKLYYTLQNVQKSTNNGVVAMGGPGELNRKQKYIQWIAYYLIPSFYVLFVLGYAAVYWE